MVPKSPYPTMILILIPLVLFAGCKQGNPPKKEISFEGIVSVKEMNSKIRFWKPDPSTDKLRIGDSVFLTLENLTKKEIDFPRDYGIKIFTYDDNSESWNEIQNGMNYGQGPGPILLPKGAESPGVLGVLFWPKLKNEGKPIDIRVVVVIGSTQDGNNPIKGQTGAFIDITLTP